MKTFGIVILGLFLFSAATFAQDKQQPLVVKGLYIGMDIKEAAKQVTAKFPEGYSLVRFNDYFYTITDEDMAWLPMGYIRSDDKDRVISIEFTSVAVDNLFKAANLEVSEFAQKFIEAYHIPSLKPTDSWDGWYYTHPDGYKVTVSAKKDLLIEKTSSAQETKDAFN